MALGDLYVTAAELKTRLGISDSTDDARITQAVEAATRIVEVFCNRQFNDAGSASERMYNAISPDVVLVDDFWTTSGLVVKSVAVSGTTETETTLISSEYRIHPLNPTRDGLYKFPYWRIQNLRTVMFPLPGYVTTTDDGLGYLKVTARWGWEAVPKPVKEATYILAEEHFKLKEAPFGVANWGEFGPMRVQENKVAYGLLRHYRRGGTRIG